MIEKSHLSLSVRRQCDLLGLARSTLYYQPYDAAEEVILTNLISEIWHEIPVYGYRRITASLNRLGHNVNHKRVLRLMKESGLQAIYPKRRLSQPDPSHKIYPYLLRGLEITTPNQVWATDLTYIRLGQGFGYLMAIIDVFSRKIIAWDVGNSMETGFCLGILSQGLSVARPQILNTDQGSQYTSKEWIYQVESNNIRVSMDGVGRWADNIPIERFWRTVKWENLYLGGCRNVLEVRTSLEEFMEFYNTRRLHSALDYATPDEVYRGVRSAVPVTLGLVRPPIGRDISLPMEQHHGNPLAA